MSDPGVPSSSPEIEDPLFFDGDTLTAMDRRYTTILWQGRADSGSGACMNNPACQDMYKVGPIREGDYFVDPGNIQRYDWWTKVKTFFGGDWPGGEVSWGNTRVPIDIPAGTNLGNRTGGFFIHGGDFPGSAGCIDLGKNASAFFN